MCSAVTYINLFSVHVPANSAYQRAVTPAGHRPGGLYSRPEGREGEGYPHQGGSGVLLP